MGVRKNSCRLVFYIFLLFSNVKFYAIGTNILLEEDISASQHSLAGGNAALNLSVASYATNPAHLIGGIAGSYAFFYDMGFQDSQILRINYFDHFNNIPISLGLAVNAPQDFYQVSNDGESIQKLNLYAGILSVHSATKTNLFNGFEIGYGGKFIYENTGTQNIYAFALDFGITKSFYLKMLDFNQKSETKNLTFGFSILNIGKARVINSQKAHLPWQLQIGLSWLAINNRNHQFFLLHNSRFNLIKEQNNQLYVPNLAFRYVFLNLLYAHLGSQLTNNRLFYTLGMGVQYDFKGLYSLIFDYSFEPNNSLQFNHQVGLQFEKKFQGFREKIDLQKNKTRKLEGFLNDEIVAMINDCLNLYYLENNEYPQLLRKILPYLFQKYELKKIPHPESGFLQYDVYSGKVEVTTQQQIKKFKDVLIMKDHSKITGNILSESERGIWITTINGKVNVRKSMIHRRYDLLLRKLDIDIVRAVKRYVTFYFQVNKIYPKTLHILIEFLQKQKILDKLPALTTGFLYYEAITGDVSIRDTEVTDAKGNIK